MRITRTNNGERRTTKRHKTKQEKEGAKELKAAERAARDVVVLRCCSVSQARNRETFILAAEEAFGRGGEPLGRELQTLLLLAYHELHRA